jgi:nucleoside-diphosphate-sugar epimerase
VKAIVTGSSGFIGGHLVAALEGMGHDVLGIDLIGGLDLLTCDLPDAEAVFHLAAQTDAYFEDAEADARANIMASLRVFLRYREKVVYASTSMVNYPANPYAISKRACEEYALLYGASVVRLCNITGVGGHSVFERFADAETLTIYGTGQQRRNYANVGNAVTALLSRHRKGGVFVLPGVEMSVNEVADHFPGKPRAYEPARPGDILDGRQIAA